MNKHFIIIFSLCLMSLPEALAQTTNNNFFENGNEWNDLNSFQNNASQNQKPQKVPTTAPSAAIKQGLSQEPKPNNHTNPSPHTQQGQAPQTKAIKKTDKKVKPVVIREQLMEQEEVEGPDMPLDFLKPDLGVIKDLKEAKEREGVNLYSPKSNQVRPRYDYRDQEVPKFYQDHLPSQVNKHIPKLLFQKEFSQMIYAAITKGDISAISALLQKGADINSKIVENGLTPLMIATKTNNAQVVRYLITKGADLNIKSNNGRTALHIATMNNLFDMFAILVKAGAQVDIKDNNDKIALEYVSPTRMDAYSLEIAEASKNRESILLDMVKLGNLNTVNYLLDESEVNIDAQNENGDTPLIIATKANNEQMVGLLLAKDATPDMANKKNITASQIAKQNQNIKLATLIETALIRKELENNISHAVNVKNIPSPSNIKAPAQKIGESNTLESTQPTNPDNNKEEDFWSKLKKGIFGDDNNNDIKGAKDLKKEQTSEEDGFNTIEISNPQQPKEEKTNDFFKDLKESLFGQNEANKTTSKKAKLQQTNEPAAIMHADIINPTMPDTTVATDNIETQKISSPSQQEVANKQDEFKLMDIFQDVVDDKNKAKESTSTIDAVVGPTPNRPISIIPQGTWSD